MATPIGFFGDRAITQSEDAQSPNDYSHANENTNNTNQTEASKRPSKKPSSLMVMKKDVKMSKLMGVYKKKSSDVVGEFADTTSTHGLSRVHKYYASKSYIMFLFWVGVFVLCSFYCARGIYLQVELYIAKPVTTSISVIRLDSMPFPDMKICPLLPYNKERMREVAKEVGMEHIFDTKRIVPASDMISFFQSLGSNDTFALEVLQYSAFKYDEVVYGCKIGGSDCGNPETDTLTTVFDPINGNCFILTTNQTQIKPGQGFGLSMMLYTSASDSLTTDLFGSDSQNGMGVRIIIGDSSDALSPSMGTLASAATQTLLQLSRADYIDNTSQRDCITIPENTRYSPQTCIANCIAEEMKRRCNCTNFISCLAVSNCTNDQNIYSASVDACTAKNECKEPCETTKYTVQSSISVWPSDPVLNSLADEYAQKEDECGPGTIEEKFNACKSLFEASLQRVEITFGDFTYTEYTRDNQFTLEQLMSQVGGLTGLFIGSSFMSIVELFEMILLVVAVYTGRTRKAIRTGSFRKSQSHESASNAGL